NHPLGSQTQCAIGEYTTMDQIPMNHSMAENFIRSAKAPQISAGVMIANVIWNIMYTDSGTFCAMWDTETLSPAAKLIPFRRKRPKFPKYGLPGMKARL